MRHASSSIKVGVIFIAKPVAIELICFLSGSQRAAGFESRCLPFVDPAGRSMWALVGFGCPFSLISRRRLVCTLCASSHYNWLYKYNIFSANLCMFILDVEGHTEIFGRIRPKNTFLFVFAV